MNYGRKTEVRKNEMESSRSVYEWRHGGKVRGLKRLGGRTGAELENKN